jgi:hypothetical protein
MKFFLKSHHYHSTVKREKGNSKDVYSKTAKAIWLRKHRIGWIFFTFLRLDEPRSAFIAMSIYFTITPHSSKFLEL